MNGAPSGSARSSCAALTPAEQRQLIACLVAVQTDNDEAFKSKLAGKIDDRNPENWVELDELLAALPA